MAVAIKRNTDIVWGTTQAGTLPSQGIVLSVSRKRNAKLFEQPNAEGENHSVVFYDPTDELSVECLATPTSTVPEPGDTVTIAGVTDAYVLDAEEVWANEDTKKIRLTLKQWNA